MAPWKYEAGEGVFCGHMGMQSLWMAWGGILWNGLTDHKLLIARRSEAKWDVDRQRKDGWSCGEIQSSGALEELRLW